MMAMDHAYYKFPDEQEFLKLEAEALTGNVVVLGVILTDPLPEDPENWGPPLEGFHVLACWEDGGPVGWAQFKRPNVEAPQWFADVPRVPPARGVPAQVTNFQARAVMRSSFLPDGRSLETAVKQALEAGRAATSALPESDPRRMLADQQWLAWEQSNVFERGSQMIQGFALALGLSSSDLDNLFLAAQEITA